MNELTKVDFDHVMKVNEAFMRVMTGDVTLAAEIAERQNDPAKLQMTLDHLRKLNEPHFAIKMGQHAVLDAAEVAALKTTLKANLRDNMDRTELAATEFAELLAIKRIEKKNAQGFVEYNEHCDKAAMIIANAMREALI